MPSICRRRCCGPDSMRPTQKSSGSPPPRSPGPSRATMFRSPHSIDAWRRSPPACRTAGPAICSSIDNLEAWAGGLDASPCRARIHYFLVKLAELAVRTKTAIVVLARLNGPAGGRVATRELAELSAIAPVVWLAANDAGERGRRLLLPVKNSLGPQASAAAFRIEAGRVAWEPGEVELSDTMLAPPSARSVAEQQDRESAAEWLIDALSDGPVESAELFRQARTCGISAKTLRRAGKALGLKPSKTSFDGPWVWGIRNPEERGTRSSECGTEGEAEPEQPERRAGEDGQLRGGKFGGERRSWPTWRGNVEGEATAVSGAGRGG